MIVLIQIRIKNNADQRLSPVDGLSIWRLQHHHQGRLGVPFIYLFIYICCCYRMVALMLCYKSMAPGTCKDDISASDIWHLYKLIVVKVGLHRFPLAVLLAYPVILRYTLLHREYSQWLWGSWLTHELALLSSWDLFSRREKTLRG